MLKLLIANTVLLVSITIKTGFSQQSDNFYIVMDSLESHFNAHPELKQEEDGSYVQYLRWKEFWKDRVYGDDSSRNGSFQHFRAAAKTFTDNIHYYNRSTIIGSDWHNMGPNSFTNYNFRGLISSVYVDTAADKNMNTIFIGTNSSGIWKTTDGGQHWYNVTDPTGITLLGITDITGDPNDGNIIYASTGFFVSDLIHTGGIGIIKSIDGGVTWEKLLSFEPSENRTVFKLLVDPYEPQRIYALIDTLLLRNNHAGYGTWDTLFKSPPIHAQHRFLRDILMKPGDPNTLYVAADDRDPSGWSYNIAKAYRIRNATSPNLGTVYAESLDELFTPPGDTILTQRYQIAVTPADTSAIYIGCLVVDTGSCYGPNFKFKLWKYDNVNSWRQTISFWQPCNDVNWNKITILVSPSDTGVVYIGGVRFKQFVHGQYHHSCDANVHDDIRYAKVYQKIPGSSGNTDIIFIGHDGGISKSTNGLLNCQNLNGDGLVITQFWGIGSAEKIPSTIYAGTQDNRLFSFEYGNWTYHNVAGDAGNPVVNYINPDTIYFPSWGDGSTRIRRSLDGGQYAVTVFTPAEVYNFNIPLGINPQNPRSIYIGCHNLWKSENYGNVNTFNKISIPYGNSNPDPISAFVIAPSDTSTLYVAFNGPYSFWGNKQQEKLIKTTNEGKDWEDLTNNLQSLSTAYGITAIEVSPTNPDSVWIAFGGYWYQWDPQHHRVLLSTDGGTTWNMGAGYSQGLPNSPVNCLKFMKGGQGRLFAGTDMGVFYRDNYSTEWQPFNSGLPVCVVKDLEVNYATQKIRAGTFGRGLYETDLSCNYNSSAWVINQNVILNYDTAIDQSILIDSSYTLTVKAKLKLPPQGKIYVQPGARLIVDGGTLTNRCYNLWQGVEIRGNNKLKQTVFNQGTAIFKNGAVLENARIGVSTNGGLISAENSFFRNNYNAVKFESYPFDQLSSFRKVTFETTRNYLDTNLSVPQDFVTLWEVRGVRFLGCTFRNTTIPSNGIPGSHKGRGIYSINASYTVDRHESCPVSVVPCPNPVYTPSIFKGLYYGIRAYNSNPARLVKVNRSVFDHNYRGIYLGVSNYATITQNQFLIPNHNQAGADTCYGLYLGTCTGYQVEANQFTSPGNTVLQPGNNFAVRNIGLIVDNSGGAPNEIYRNRFDSLDIAINCQRVNRQDGGAITDGPGGSIPYPIAVPTGLVVKCNTYVNNSFDEMATPGYDYGLEGIARNQGAITAFGKDQAGNTFSPYHQQAQIPESDLKNVADNLTYYHQIQTVGLRIYPDFHTPLPKILCTQVNNYFIYDTCCFSKLPSTNPVATDLQQKMEQEGQTIQSLITQLKALVDGGETEEKNDNIATSTPPEALDIRDDLLNSSPYLSDTVMKSAIEKESVLPNEMIRDILVANPQAAKTDEVLNTLDYRFVPMPDPMMEEILEGREEVSPKEILEAQIAQHVQEFRMVFNGLVRFYLTDSLAALSNDSLVDFLETKGLLEGKYLLLSEYLQDADTVSMDNLINSIPDSYSLDRTGQSIYQDVQNYCAFRKSLLGINMDILQLDSTRAAQMFSLYEQSGEPVQSVIRNILVANDLLQYREPLIIPGNIKSTDGENNPKTKRTRHGHYLKMFPNPANRYVIADYSTGEDADDPVDLQLIVTSADGKTVYSGKLNKPVDQQLIKTTGFIPGIYVCSLMKNGQVITSGKFQVVQ